MFTKEDAISYLYEKMSIIPSNEENKHENIPELNQMIANNSDLYFSTASEVFDWAKKRARQYGTHTDEVENYKDEYFQASKEWHKDISFDVIEKSFGQIIDKEISKIENQNRLSNNNKPSNQLSEMDEQQNARTNNRKIGI